MPTPTSTPCAATVSFDLTVESCARLGDVLALLAPEFRRLFEENGVTVKYIRQSTDDVVPASNYLVWDIPAND